MSLGMFSADGDPSYVHHMTTCVLQHLCRDILIRNLGGPTNDPSPILQGLDGIREGWMGIGPPLPV
ncbi:hypothetical protein [Streptomyces pratensis]|uniref:hypothetical protein n=1 Tax=Streptomyces pratensis TaxID=1169025 RepID=UPI0019316FDC|nr:hypothetical protein [Streptomyces pratensis]